MNINDNEIEKSLSNAVLCINVSNEKKIEFQRETELDPILKKIKEYVINGWQRNKAKCDEIVKFYFKFRNDIFIDDDILFMNDRQK